VKNCRKMYAVGFSCLLAVGFVSSREALAGKVQIEGKVVAVNPSQDEASLVLNTSS